MGRDTSRTPGSVTKRAAWLPSWPRLWGHVLFPGSMRSALPTGRPSNGALWLDLDELVVHEPANSDSTSATGR